MNSRQASGAEKRWREAFLGSVAGLGARVLLGSAARLLGFKSNPVAVGGMAGLVGALVGGGLARRKLSSASGEPEAEEALPVAPRGSAGLRPVALSPEPPSEERWAPRRGPNGRERHWYFEEGSSHIG